MSKKKTLAEALRAIHDSLEEAQYQLSQIDERLQFLISSDGSINIVRRDKTGETAWPRIVVAELRGVDPMFWRPELPEWLHSLDPESEAAVAAGNGSAHRPGDGGNKPGGSRPPAVAEGD